MIAKVFLVAAWVMMFFNSALAFHAIDSAQMGVWVLPISVLAAFVLTLYGKDDGAGKEFFLWATPLCSSAITLTVSVSALTLGLWGNIPWSVLAIVGSVVNAVHSGLGVIGLFNIVFSRRKK